VHRLHGACVLVVDDDADAAELYALWLRNEGHRVSIAGDATRALILAPLLSPALIVIDIGLPGMDGIELVSKLRERSELTHCKYIAVSAYMDERLPAHCLAAGFAAFFQKPMPMRQLTASVSAAVGLHQNRRDAPSSRRH